MPIKIALAGNPNCGKTTMFNDLTGSAQYVGNWPGVTVEKKEGRLRDHEDVIIQDLPGIYSLSPYTPEEIVARNYLVSEKPDAIINIVDGTNIERNLYLTTQLMELGIPIIIAMNMIDIVRKNGDIIHLDKLGKALGCEVIETSALRKIGSVEVAKKAALCGAEGIKGEAPHVFEGAVEHALAHIEESICNLVPKEQLRWYAIKVFERDPKVIEQLQLDAAMVSHLDEHIQDCERELDDDAESIITNQRYNYVEKLVQVCVKKKNTSNLSTSDKIDRIITDRWLALPIFAAIMTFVYYVSVTTVGSIVTDFTNKTLFGNWILPAVAAGLKQMAVAPWLTSLISDGIIGGVGSVLGFVPQMFILFFLLSILEDVGYMSRVAFIMDRIFRKFGLSGKSFIPMLIGSGCSVPGIMASRTIESQRDRRMTIMTTSFIPCGAKMPLIALISGALFGGSWWVSPSAYFLGVSAVAISGIMLKKTALFAGEPSPFVMELPAYHIPSATNVLRSTWERGWSFIKKAGTIILVASVLIWLLSNLGFSKGQFALVWNMDQSILASIGNFMAPAFAPLGFGSWQATVATLMGLLAKEQVVGTFGVLFGVTGDALKMVNEGAYSALAPIASHFTPLSAYAFLVFNLLCAPCFSAIGAIRREMNSARWTWYALAYLTVFAYAVTLMVYQFGLLLSGGPFTVFTALAVLVFGTMVYFLVRNPRK